MELTFKFPGARYEENDISLVLALHQDMIEVFGGSSGVRDEGEGTGTLESCSLPDILYKGAAEQC